MSDFEFVLVHGNDFNLQTNVFEFVIGGARGAKGDTGDTGDAGAKGDTGDTGAKGDTGAGVPSGGNAGDSIIKSSGIDFAFIILKNNLTANVAPAITDDSGSGYAVKSLWIDTVADKVYQCLGASVGAAVWIDLTGGGLWGRVESRVMTGNLIELFDIGADDNVLFLVDNLVLSNPSFAKFALSLDNGATYPSAHSYVGGYRRTLTTAEGDIKIVNGADVSMTYAFANKLGWWSRIELSQVADAAAATQFDAKHSGHDGASFERVKVDGLLKTIGVVNKFAYYPRLSDGATMDSGYIHHLRRLF